MSYKPYYSDDHNTTSMFISTIDDCILACKKMTSCNNDPWGFIRWFEKAKKIDPRTTYMFLKQHMDEIPHSAIVVVKIFFEKMDERYKKVKKNE